MTDRIATVKDQLGALLYMNYDLVEGIWSRPSPEVCSIALDLCKDLPEHYDSEYILPTKDGGIFITSNVDSTCVTINEGGYMLNTHLNNGHEEPIPFEAEFSIKSKASMVHLIKILTENDLTSK